MNGFLKRGWPLLLLVSLSARPETGGLDITPIKPRSPFFNKEQNDKHYIKKADGNFLVMVSSNNWLDVYNLNIIDYGIIKFQSDLTYNLGMKLGYRSLSIGYNVQLSDILGRKEVKKKQWDASCHFRDLGLEFFSIKNEGETNVTSIYSYPSDSLFEPFSGLKVHAWGGAAYYYFNGKKYSNAAAYTAGNIKKQVKSAGSVIAKVSYSKHDVGYDLSELKTQYNLTIGDELLASEMEYANFCLGIGYGYNYVITPRWMVNLSVIPSAGVKRLKEKTTSSRYSFTMENNSKLAVIYNWSKCFVSIACLYRSDWFFANNYSFENSVGTFDISLGKRF